MQSDCLYSSLFLEHYNRILVWDCVLGHCSVCSFDGVSCHNAFAFYLASTSLGVGALLSSSVVLRMSVTLWFCLQRSCKKCL